MFKINENYKNLSENYLFTDIARKVRAYEESNPQKKIIRMGIGDVTRPLAPAVVKALEEASREQGTAEGFHGYGPEQGYDFLREKIKAYYESFGVKLSLDEIFISDGAKSDVANITDLFSKDNKVLVPDPVYPVYLDTNIMDGREITFIDANEDNGFLPLPDTSIDADIIYLCSPNNPTGACYGRDKLDAWLDYAIKKGAVLLFDAAYEAFINDPLLPRSIYQMGGSRGCAIEFCSLSKTAGFTGTRCSYTIVPKELPKKLNQMWLRRQTTKYNGVSYIVQRGAEAAFSQEGLSQIKENIDYYRVNARLITDALDKLGIWYTGGKNSPYIWMKCPNGMDSWSFFDYLLNGAQVVGTPGAGFGKNGEGFFRLTAFSTNEATKEAMERLAGLLAK